jgi:hypothetical protein
MVVRLLAAGVGSAVWALLLFMVALALMAPPGL